MTGMALRRSSSPVTICPAHGPYVPGSLGTMITPSRWAGIVAGPLPVQPAGTGVRLQPNWFGFVICSNSCGAPKLGPALIGIFHTLPPTVALKSSEPLTTTRKLVDAFDIVH